MDHWEDTRVVKHLCNGNEELYKKFLKRRIKVGNDFVTQDRNDDQVSILMQPPTDRHLYVIVLSGFEFRV